MVDDYVSGILCALSPDNDTGPYVHIYPILTVALGLTCSLAASQAMGQLRVDLSSQNREWGYATLQEASEGLYGVRSGMAAENLQGVRCSEGGELSAVEGRVVVPRNCGDLNWEFHLKPYPVEGVMASGQLSWYSDAPNRWIISEGDVILQGPGMGAATGVSFFLDGRPLEIRAGPRRLPALNQAPGFWLLGHPVHVDKGSIRHFFDRETIPRHLAGLLDSHSAGIGYLLEMLPPAELPPVFWMGLAEWRLSVGGAAGTGLVLANYPLRARDFDRRAYAITLYVVLHEHGHHLFDGTGPLWIGESLASYLAIKAIRETAPEIYSVVEEAFIAPGLAIETPLPVLGERAAAGDGHAYTQVYMGAAFWMAIDDAMVGQGGHGSFLQALPDALARGFTSGGAPRPKEIAQVTGLAPGTLNPILDRYLGTE
ncbi:MAG: hypothetical protein OXG29_12160 [Gammaproteobacteria bacterium]|nr:hypothetical protein [Gammaproteobacteria bacterium]